MKILVKFPSRERPEKFASVLKQYQETSTNVRYLIILDQDDPTINRYPKEVFCGEIIIGFSGSKIKAINRDMDKSGEWDILVLASDDMIPQTTGWDIIITEAMKECFPDTDGVLWFNDGYLGRKLNTMCILGRKYFDRFGYIYHPEYKSLWCDNEFTDVANMLDKQKYFDKILFKHEHFSNNRQVRADQLMMRNESYYLQDEATYKRHKINNFGI